MKYVVKISYFLIGFILILGVFFILLKKETSQDWQLVKNIVSTNDIKNIVLENINKALVVNKNSAVQKITSEVTLPKNYYLENVPFIPQAPLADWQDPRQQDGCEEAAILMAWHWVTNQPITDKKEMLAEILKLSSYQEEKNGNFHDTSAADTALLMEQYFQYQKVESVKEATIDKIKKALVTGKLVITPMNGQIIGNPFYTGAGPARHMIVIIGYDEERQEFITNDPGTRRGQNYRYNYQIFLAAIRDYPTGNHLPISQKEKNMIVVSK